MEQMEQRVLQLEYDTAQANTEKDVAKTELNMRTVEKIELEERIKSLKLQHEEFREKSFNQGE